jgi:hypothetical protein
MRRPTEGSFSLEGSREMSLGQEIDALVETCRRDVPNCVGVGVVDLSTGMMLRSETSSDLGDDLVELLGAATVELLQGRVVRQVEELVRARRGTAEPEHYVEEMLLQGPGLVHLFLRSRRHPDLALGVACARSVKIGLLFSQARRALREFDDRGGAAAVDATGAAAGEPS